MRKRIFSIFLAVAMIFCSVPLSAYADEHQHTFENKHGYDLSNLPEGYSIPCKIYESPCSDECGYSLYSWDVFGLSGQFVDKSGTSGLTVYQHYREWFEKIYGQNATAKQYETGGGSADGSSGVGRNPSGYLNDTGAPSYNSNGELQVAVYPRLGFSDTGMADYPASLRKNNNASVWTISGLTVTGRGTSSTGTQSQLIYYDYSCEAPVSGTYFLSFSQTIVNHIFNGSDFYNDSISAGSYSRHVYKGSTATIEYSKFYDYHKPMGQENSTVVTTFSPLIVSCVPDTVTVNKQTNITINNNTWNGNIYQDNSTNLTYIYPEYTTINENNETVTNISENPIIYNSETNEYYTYDSVTNNYYYITYVTETPTPTPSPDPTPTPDPGTDPAPTPEPTEKPDSSNGSGTNNNFWNFVFPGSDDGTDNGHKGILWALISLLIAVVTFVLGLGNAYAYVFPFLPAGLVTTIHICVLVLLLFAIIKFVRSFL